MQSLSNNYLKFVDRLIYYQKQRQAKKLLSALLCCTAIKIEDYYLISPYFIFQCYREILRKGGSAADAAIAALFCDGVTVPHGCGLGGGSLFTIYTRSTGKVETLNSRESAPMSASKNMYNKNSTLARKGGLAVAVPGELIGYWELHQKYGKLPWDQLVQPTIDLCRKGHLVTKYLADVWKYKERDIFEDPTLRYVIADLNLTKLEQ